MKTNIGHTEAAAGIAGLIKAVLMLRHQTIPASLHFTTLNPHIDLGGVPIEMPTASTEAELGCVGVSSFGFSGTNAHVVLERAPGEDARRSAAGSLLTLSARDPAALEQLRQRAGSKLCRTRADLAALARSAAAARACLIAWLWSPLMPRLHGRRSRPPRPPPLAVRALPSSAPGRARPMPAWPPG